MRVRHLLVPLLFVSLSVAVPAARADGPFEPNETAATAFGPVTQPADAVAVGG